jgi:iron(III) transport system substrate-binding protein
VIISILVKYGIIYFKGWLINQTLLSDGCEDVRLHQEYIRNSRETENRDRRSRMIRSTKSLLAVLIASTIVLIAFAVIFLKRTDTAEVPEKSGPQTLQAAAQREAIVNIWATNAEDLNWIPEAFEKFYPGIKVEIYTDLNVASRVIAEDRAGLNNVDVVWNSEGLIRPLVDRDLLVGNEWPALGISAEDIAADGRMAVTSSVAYAIAYRTDRVASADVPTTWAELTDAKFRGKMAASPILFARLCAGLGAFETPDPWLTFARKVHDESQTLWSNDLLEQAIVSGERPYVVATANYLAERWKARGLPVEVVLPDPVFIAHFGSVVMKRAPHPNAARLLAVWLAGADGKAAREQALFAIDLRPSSEHPKAVELRASNKRLYLDTKETIEARNKLIPEMDKIFSGLK